MTAAVLKPPNKADIYNRQADVVMDCVYMHRYILRVVAKLRMPLPRPRNPFQPLLKKSNTRREKKSDKKTRKKGG